MTILRSLFAPAVAVALCIGATGCAADTEDDASSLSQEVSAAARWQRLGSRTVDGSADRDVIVVGADEGAFTAIKVKVQGAALLMEDITVTFGNGDTFRPNVSWFFDADTSTRAIDLPGNARNIKKVAFRYGNVPGGRDATVQLLGKTAAPPPWQTLGSRRVEGPIGSGRIVTDDDAVTAIKLRVEDASLALYDVKVTFGNGDVFRPELRLVFDENSASRVIDLPGQARHIKRIDFNYANFTHGQRAGRVLVSGKTATPPPWENLGELRVDGDYDTGRINVGTDEGKFRKINFRVEDSSLAMFDVKVTFGNGETFSPGTRLIFEEGTRSRVIDLPGEARYIKRVDFKYGNLPTGGDARVQFWGLR